MAKARSDVGTSSVLRRQVKDIDHATRELMMARDELAAIDPTAHRYRRVLEMKVPFGRLRLVRRYIDELLDSIEVPA